MNLYIFILTDTVGRNRLGTVSFADIFFFRVERDNKIYTEREFVEFSYF